MRVVIPGQGRRRRPGRDRLSALDLPTVTAAGLSKQIGGRTLFRDVSFTLEARDRVALSGRNGSGKTTLLRALAGEEGLDGGTLALAKGARVALHDQRPPRADRSLREYVTAGLAWMLEIERELAALEDRMARGDADGASLAAYADAQSRLEHSGGYRWRDQAVAVVHALGFLDDELDRPLASFSGGELTRASLARALASRPELLLLDEPTNHLDIESLEWLERHLVGLDAAVVFVAHDRWFLESVGTAVLEIEGERGRFFAGRWHAWREERARRELAAGREVERRKAEIARMERFVERFRYKATKARQAQSRVKRIERLRGEASEPQRGDQRSLSFSFGGGERSGRVVLELEGATVTAGDRVLIEQGSLWLERGEHVCLVGANGSGKSTLLETLVGNREPTAGKLRRGHNVTTAYLPQHTEPPTDPAVTVLSHAQRATGLTEARTQALLGQFLFSGDEVYKRVAELSGGESRRLALAILVTSEANLLILDEPTNHLDVESRESLEDALVRYPGTLLLISHDRALLEAVGRRTVVLADRRLTSHPGRWAEYRQAAEEGARASTPARRSARRPPRSAGPSKNSRAELERLEGEVERADAALATVEAELADPSRWASPDSAERSTRRHRRAKRDRDEALARWEAAAEAVESAIAEKGTGRGGPGAGDA